MTFNIAEISFDKKLVSGAHNAVAVCLDIKPDERVTVITDNESLEIAASLVSEIKKIGAEYHVFVI
jgi:leucyl aminopeptidase (aminopeptidase T)